VPATNHFEEKTLIQRARQGDADAVAELYHRHAPAIFRYLFFRLHDQATAEDITAEVFLEMVKALPRYRERGAPFAAWLFQIAHSRLVDHHRYAARRPTEPLSESITDETPGPEARVALMAETRRLSEALARLTDEQQMVIQLRFIEGYNLEDSAAIMGKSTGAIKALQHRALNSLGRKLDYDA
jgi:RNA polymerase sigma-70 factor (ECF subfamily)